MLSKLALRVSRGRNSPTSTWRPSRSSTALANSARLSRWKVRNPGLGFCSQAASTRASSSAASASRVSPAGRGNPRGGIIPARSLRIIRSAVSAISGADSTSNAWNEMLPVMRASLWQTWQYVRTTPVSEATRSGNDGHIRTPGRPGNERRLVGSGREAGSAGRSTMYEKQPERGEHGGKRVHAGLTLLYTGGAGRCGGSRKPFVLPRLLPQLQRIIRIAFALRDTPEAGNAGNGGSAGPESGIGEGSTGGLANAAAGLGNQTL